MTNPHPESWRYATGAVLVAWAVSLGLWNVLARVCGGEEATVSLVLSDAARKWPVVAFGIGLLVGHWLWPLR